MATQVSEGMLLWEPSEKTKQESNLRKYMQWLEQKRGLHFTGPEELWAWSVDKLEDFWASLWDYFEIQAFKPYHTLLEERRRPRLQSYPAEKPHRGQHLSRNPQDNRPARHHL